MPRPAYDYNIFEDPDYVAYRKRVEQIETVEEAAALMKSLSQTVDLCQWTIVDILRHFQQSKPYLLPQLEEYMKNVLNMDSSKVSQIKKVAEVFGDVEKRFPALSFSHHIILAYAVPHLGEELVMSLAQEAQLKFWSVSDLRRRLEFLRQKKVIESVRSKQTEPEPILTETDIKAEAADVTETAEVAETITEPADEIEESELEVVDEIDIKREAEEADMLLNEELARELSGRAIMFSDAYVKYRKTFLRYVAASLQARAWDLLLDLLSLAPSEFESLESSTYTYEDILERITVFLREVEARAEGNNE